MIWLLHKIGQQKDALLALAALASPFAAVFAALVASKRSAAATIASTEKQRETSLEIAERNTRVTVRATNRQNWINELRQEIAEFLSLLPAAHGIRRQDPTFDMVDIGRRLALHHAKIALLINPQKTKYVSLKMFVDEAMNNAGDSMGKGHADISVMTADMDKIVHAAQEIFGEQWQRVKNLE